MATVFLSKQRNRNTKIKITKSRKKPHKETNKKKPTQIGLLTEAEGQKIQREHQAELKTQPEYCGFDATVGVSHQAPKLKVYPPITVVSNYF